LHVVLTVEDDENGEEVPDTFETTVLTDGVSRGVHGKDEDTEGTEHESRGSYPHINSSIPSLLHIGLHEAFLHEGKHDVIETSCRGILETMRDTSCAGRHRITTTLFK
jgi:hypothetical protein